MSPEERSEAIMVLNSTATHDILAAAPLLTAARGEKDYVRLGLESWAEYLDQVGVSRSQDSKLRKAYHAFGIAWGRAMSSKLTLERLYLAARVAERDGLDYEQGLALAVSTPSHEIIADLRGEELEPTLCVCDACGQSHRRKEPA